MQVSIEDKSTVKKIIHVEIPSKDVAAELDKDYKEINKKTTLKGFRKGKIPRKVLESRFAKNVHAEVSSRLIQKAFIDTLEEHNINILGNPQIEPPEIKPGEDYVFDMTVEVKPELEDIEFKGIELKKNMYKVSEDDVEQQMFAIRKDLATKETVTEERQVKKDDFVLIDYQGFLNGVPYDKTPKVENYVMVIGSPDMPGEFSNRLTGAIPEQEMEIEVSYPEESPNKDIAGKTINYKVVLKEIQEEILPPADETLLEKLGQFESLEALKIHIRQNLETGNAKRVEHELVEQVFQALLEKYQFEVPDIFVESELEGILREAQGLYKQNNMTLEDVGLSDEMIKGQYRHVAEKQARRHILLGKIIDQEKLELTDEDIENGFKKMAMDMRVTVDFVKNFFQKDEKQFEHFKYIQLEKKAADIIVKNGNITEVEPELEEALVTEAETNSETEAEPVVEERVAPEPDTVSSNESELKTD